MAVTSQTTRTQTGTMQVTIEIPDAYKDLPSQAQQNFLKEIENHAKTDVSFYELEEMKTKKYDPETEEILRLATQKAKISIQQGESSEQSFERLDKVMNDIGNDLKNNPEYLEAVKNLESQ